MKLFLSLILAVAAFAQTAKFPGQVADDQHLKVAGNFVVTRLKYGVKAGDTIWTVADASRIVPHMLLTCEREIVSVTSVDGNNLTVERGFDGTAAAAHTSNREVGSYPTAWDKNVLAAEIKAMQATLSNTTSSMVDIRLYGATCDGSDQNAAVMAAIASGAQRLFLPAGCMWKAPSSTVTVSVTGENSKTSKISAATSGNYLILAAGVSITNVSTSHVLCTYGWCEVQSANNTRTTGVAVADALNQTYWPDEHWIMLGASDAGSGAMSVVSGTDAAPLNIDETQGNYNGIYEQIASDLGTAHSGGAAINFHAVQNVMGGGAGGGTARNFLGDLVIPNNTLYDGDFSHFNAIPGEFRLTTYRPGFYDTMALLLQIKGQRTGTVNTSGTTVTRVSGHSFYAGQAGTTITISGVPYTISSVTNANSLVIGGSAGTQTGANYSAPNVVNISTGIENSVEVAPEAVAKGLAVYSAQIALEGVDANPSYSAAYLIKSSSADNTGIQHGIQIIPDYAFPIASSGTLFRSRGGTVAKGIDFSEMTFTDSAFKSSDFSVSPNGSVTAAALSRATTVSGDFAMTNNIYFGSGAWRAYANGGGAVQTMTNAGVYTLQLAASGTKDAAVTLIPSITINPTNGYITETNGIKLAHNAEPTCNSTNAGDLVRTAGGVGVADSVRMCLKKSDNTYAYISIVTVP